MSVTFSYNETTEQLQLEQEHRDRVRTTIAERNLKEYERGRWNPPAELRKRLKHTEETLGVRVQQLREDLEEVQREIREHEYTRLIKEEQRLKQELTDARGAYEGQTCRLKKFLEEVEQEPTLVEKFTGIMKGLLRR